MISEEKIRKKHSISIPQCKNLDVITNQDNKVSTASGCPRSFCFFPHKNRNFEIIQSGFPTLKRWIQAVGNKWLNIPRINLQKVIKNQDNAHPSFDKTPLKKSSQQSSQRRNSPSRKQVWLLTHFLRKNIDLPFLQRGGGTVLFLHFSKLPFLVLGHLTSPSSLSHWANNQT